MEKKILIVGSGNSGLSDSIKLAAKQHNICILNDVMDDQFTEPIEQKTFKFKAPVIIEETFADLKEPVFNQRKHNNTCAKNRKKKKEAET